MEMPKIICPCCLKDNVTPNVYSFAFLAQPDKVGKWHCFNCHIDFKPEVKEETKKVQ